MKYVLSVSLFVLFFLFPVSADEVDAPKTHGLTIGCMTCHSDTSNEGVPNSIATYDVETLRKMLLGFKQGNLQGTIMNRIMKGYSDKEIELIIQQLKAAN